MHDQQPTFQPIGHPNWMAFKGNKRPGKDLLAAERAHADGRLSGRRIVEIQVTLDPAALPLSGGLTRIEGTTGKGAMGLLIDGERFWRNGGTKLVDAIVAARKLSTTDLLTLTVTGVWTARRGVDAAGTKTCAWDLQVETWSGKIGRRSVKGGRAYVPAIRVETAEILAA